ncbi:MAG: 6-pyruvoyl-tetrahydropterin synthase-related protein [Myxococcota bacterium]
MFDRFPLGWRLLPLLMTVPVLLLVPAGEPAVKPVSVVALAAVGLVLARTLMLGERGRGADWVLTFLLGVAATHLLFMPGFPRGHDISTHLWGTYGFLQAIDAGNYWPRWIHELGLGMPFLLFYAPLPFYSMLPFHWAGFPTYDCFKYAFMLFNALSGVSMYVVCYRWTGSRRASVVAAAAYCFAPYHLCESNLRVAIAEACAMMSLPPFFWCMERALSTPSRIHRRWAAFWTALLALSHPLSLVMAGTGMGLYVLASEGLKPTQALKQQLGRLLGLGLLGVALAGAFTLPVIVEGRYTTVSHSLGGKVPMYADHGLYPQDLLHRRAWTKWQKSEGHGSKDAEMPFYFGLTLLAMIPLARMREEQKRRRGLLGLALGSLALTLYPLDLLGYLPNLIILQFPWRFLAIATCGAAILVAFATRELLKETEAQRWQVWIPGVLVALMVFDFFPYQGAPLWQKPFTGIQRYAEKTVPADLPLRVDFLQYPPATTDIEVSTFRRVYPEYFTPLAKKSWQRSKDAETLQKLAIGLSFEKGQSPQKFQPAPYAAFVPTGASTELPLSFTRAGEQIEVNLPGQAGTLTVKEMHFPGWVGTLGERTVPVQADETGLMRFTLTAADQGTLRLVFSRWTWDRLGGILLSLGVGLYLFWPRKKDAQSPPEPTDQAAPESVSDVAASAPAAGLGS